MGNGFPISRVIVTSTFALGPMKPLFCTTNTTRPPSTCNGAVLPFNPQRVLFNYIDDAGTLSPMFAQSSGARLRELLDLRFNIGREMHDNRENSYAENNGDR